MHKTDFQVDSASGIATLTLMVALGQMAVGMVIPSLPALADYLQTDMGAVQLTLTVHFTAFAFFQLLAGPLSDRFGRRPVILTGLALCHGSHRLRVCNQHLAAARRPCAARHRGLCRSCGQPGRDPGQVGRR